MSRLQDMPVRDAVVNKDGSIAEPWRLYLRQQSSEVASAPTRQGQTALTAQAASLSATAVPVTVTDGLWRLSFYARLTQAATTSSSLIVTLKWTDGGVLCGLSGAAITGNTTDSVQSGTALVRADGNTSLLYQTTYASVGATPMQYQLDVVAERVQA